MHAGRRMLANPRGFRFRPDEQRKNVAGRCARRFRTCSAARAGRERCPCRRARSGRGRRDGRDIGRRPRRPAHQASGNEGPRASARNRSDPPRGRSVGPHPQRFRDGRSGEPARRRSRALVYEPAGISEAHDRAQQALSLLHRRRGGKARHAHRDRAAAHGRERVQSHGVFALARLRPVAIHSLDRQDFQAEPELLGGLTPRRGRLHQCSARLSAGPVRAARRLAPGARLLQLRRKRRGARDRTKPREGPADRLPEPQDAPRNARLRAQAPGAQKHHLEPEAFGASFEPIPNEPYFVTVPTPSAIDIRLAATFAEMSVDELIALNPALNRPMISGPHTQTLVLPADRLDAFQRNLDVYDQPLTSWQPYTMKGGDSLDRLAAKHAIALSKLKLANGITSRTKVGPGFQLLLPLKGSGVGAQPLPAVFRPPVQSAPRRGGLVHIVRKGETLYGISRRYRVSTDSLLRWNHVGVLTTGQRLIIYRAPGKARKP